MDLVILFQQKLCEIGAILTGNAGDESTFFQCKIPRSLLLVGVWKPDGIVLYLIGFIPSAPPDEVVRAV